MVYYSCPSILSLFTQTLRENQYSLSAQFCGPREIRTLDLLNAIEARSQLRYGPILFCKVAYSSSNRKVDLEGFEPSTSSVRLKRAPRLRYRPSSRASRILLEPSHTVKEFGEDGKSVN